MAGQAQRTGEEELPDTELFATLESTDAAEDVLRWIDRRYDNEETNEKFRLALRAFGKHVTDGDEVTGSVEGVPEIGSGLHSKSV